MIILGIESSADETAASVVEDGHLLLSSEVASSLDLHTLYGGIVPEIASRSHLEIIVPVIERALATAKASWDDIDAIAVTQAPGLMGSLLIGVLTSRTLAILKRKPLYAINHVEAHVLANFITETKLPGYRLPTSPPQFPLLALTVSGGHTQITYHQDFLSYKLLGQTRDDAVGEAFDKVAKILGLPYPGGPSVSAAAAQGDPSAFDLPKAKLDSPYDFSFSGLKTAVLRAAQAKAGKDYTFSSTKLAGLLKPRDVADLAASFQKTAIDTLVEALVRAEQEYKPQSILLAGGVAANQSLREAAQKSLSTPVIWPDIKLCTDNAAMIAVAGYHLHKNHKEPADAYRLEPIASF